MRLLLPYFFITTRKEKETKTVIHKSSLKEIRTTFTYPLLLLSITLKHRFKTYSNIIQFTLLFSELSFTLKG